MKYALNAAQERDEGDVIASFFFNARGQSFEKSAEGMYRSLLHQILTKLRHLYSDRIHVYQQAWPVEMLEAMLQTSVLALNPEDHLVLYIDALDECNPDEIREVVGCFEDLVELAVSRGLRCSICLSSRHYPHITIQKFEELKLDDRSQHVEDISKYIHSHVSRLSISYPVKAKIEADIRHRSSGIFLWAVLVIRILREKYDDGAPLSQLMRSLSAVPDQLETLFTRILADSEKGTITAFQWMLYARKSPQPQNLYFAIKTSTNQLSTGEWNRDDADQDSIKRFITRATRGLVEFIKKEEVFEDDFSDDDDDFDGDDNNSYKDPFTLQFIHESVREYLLQGGLASLTASNPSFVEGSAHAEIARCCLSYIQLDSSKYLQHSQTDQFSSWFSPERFPLHNYATFYLFKHADLAYRAGALSLTFLSELPVRLLICSQNLLGPRFGPLPSESATILYLLLSRKAHTLAADLLAGCSKTARPGIVTFETTARPIITFDINICCDDFHGGVLGLAAWYGKIQLVQQLLYLGAELASFDMSALICATKSGHKDVVELLLQCGACTDAVENSVPLNAAFLAAIRAASFLGADPFKDIAELLLQHGADVDAVDDCIAPQTALMTAVVTDDHSTLSMLLAHGADVHYRNKYGTALDFAFCMRLTESAQLLWEAHFPASGWDRTLLACRSKTVRHWSDTATVDRGEYETWDEGNIGYNSE
jgi:hypothetical protein